MTQSTQNGFAFERIRPSNGFLVLAGLFITIVFLLLFDRSYLANADFFALCILAEIVFGAVCKFRQVFFIILMTGFLWAGCDVPLGATWLQLRWFILGTGALAGTAIYIRDRNHYFGAFHLISFFCVVTAAVSAMVSSYSSEALLKSLSLLLLFAYGCSGARVAVSTVSPEKFFRGLIIGCEVITCITAFCYVALRQEIFGASNSLGLVAGVVLIPILCWGMLISQTRWSRCRLGFELLLAILLLLVSFARAGFVAALFSSFLVLGALRQYRLLIKISSAAIALGVLVVMILPPIQDAPKRDESQSVLSMFLYKGKPQEKAWSSRKGPWEHTWSVITENPWFGSGFGTSQITEGLPHQEFAHVGASHVIREHGSSYLAITEWVGLLGVIPFLALVGLLLWHVQQVIVKLLRNQYVPPLAIITAWVLLAGLINAFFEDWLFAVGYYMCVFFWSLAFIFMDLLHFQGSTSTHQDSSEISAFAYSR